MRVKIGTTIYDSLEEPIMIIFDDGEQEQITNMVGLDKYCSYPPGRPVEEIEDFMEFEEE